MNLMNEFLVITFTAIVLQNAIFARGLGSSKDTIMMSSPKRILLFGSTLTFITVISSLLAWPFNYLLHANEQFATPLHLRYILVLCSICIVFTLLYLLTKNYLPVLHYYLKSMIALASFNCAVLGSMLIAFNGNYGLLKTIGFAFGSGVGYTLALLLIYEGKRRIVLSDVPRAFRGVPITLLYIGILSLAIYGLIGHQLPT
ncbi:Rnf-Nqr domain containing protein [Oscillospiraceae bacterium PP1C4]